MSTVSGTCMAIEHDGRRPLPGGLDRLGAVVAGVVRRFTDASHAEHETGLSDTKRVGGRRNSPGKRTTTGRLGAEDFLGPEECIVDAIERRGGAVKQSEIVSAVEWSESTVSRKLSDLESREAVSRYQIGREKLVFLPGHEPAAVESPLALADADGASS